jgi:hypothetical protein
MIIERTGVTAARSKNFLAVELTASSADDRTLQENSLQMK